MLLGYIEFVMLLFLPGLAVLLLFNQVKSNGFLSILARSYGLSLSLNSLVMFAVSAIAINPSAMPVALLASSVGVTLVFGVFRFRSIRLHLPVVSRLELVAFLLAVAFAALILAQFVKYPVFPKFFSVDFLQHFRITRDISQGIVPAAAGVLYYGVHYNLALGYLLVGGDAFVQIQYLMAVLVAPASILIYELARLLYKRAHLALLTQFLFVATGFLWYLPLYDTGLYPNLFAIVLSLAYVAELQTVLAGEGRGRFATFTFIAFAMYLSHYSTPILLVATVVSISLGGVLRRIQFRKALIPMVITAVPLVGLLQRPDLVGFGLRILGETQTIGSFTFSTPLADLFSFSPFMKFTIAEIFNNGSIVLFFGLPFAIYYLWRNKEDSWILTLFPIWFVLLWILAPNGELAWRFSFIGLAPLIILSPATFVVVPRFVSWLLGSNQERRRRKAGRSGRGGFPTTDAITIGAMILLTLAGSWTSIMLYDLSLDIQSYSQAQKDLYDSMLWFSQGTPEGSKLLAVTDWRIAFLEPLTGRVGQLISFAPGPDAIAYAKSNGYDYLLVTYYIPANTPPITDPPAFYGSFEKNQNLKIVYQNSDDVIYEMVG